MAERKRTIAAFALLIAWCGCGLSTPERLLDEACRDRKCPTTGSARETTGLTADSIGFELGPGAGSVTIRLPSHHLDDGLTHPIELMARGSGQLVVTIAEPSCAQACSPRSVDVTEHWQWVPAGSVEIDPARAEDIELVVETRDSATRAELLDLRGL